MALTRKYLNALGIEQDKVDEIINAHSDTVNGLKGKIDELEEQIKSMKADADASKAVQKELDELKKQVEAEAKEREGKDYDALLEEFNNYKAEQKKKETDAVKKNAFTELLKDMKVSEKGMEMIFKWQGVDAVELDESGKISNAKDLRKSVKEEWGDYMEIERNEGADENNPPGGNGGKGGTGMTKEEIMKITDTTARQKAIADNRELFGI